jgi:glycosyl transferase family 87
MLSFGSCETFTAEPPVSGKAALLLSKRPTNVNIVLALAVGGILLIHAGVWWQARRSIATGYPDFTIFYSAGTMVRLGLGHQLYDERAEWRIQQQVAPRVAIRAAALPYMHAPFEALLFWPFSYLPYTGAYLLWDLANLLVLLLAARILRPHCPALWSYPLILWVVLFFAFTPVFMTLLEGQDTILLLLLYTLAFAAIKKNAAFAGGCWLALGLFRVHLVAPFALLMLLLKKWKFLSGFFLTTAALAALSAAVIGGSGLIRYPAYIWSLEHHRGTTILSPEYTVAFRGLAEQFLAHAFGPPGVLLAVVASSLAAILLVAWKWRTCSHNDPERLDLVFSITLIAVLLVGYHTLLYDLTLLLLPAAVVLNHALLHPTRRREQRGLLVPIAVFFFTPLYAVFWSLEWKGSNLMALVLLAWGFTLWREVSRWEALSQPAGGQAKLAC